MATVNSFTFVSCSSQTQIFMKTESYLHMCTWPCMHTLHMQIQHYTTSDLLTAITLKKRRYRNGGISILTIRNRVSLVRRWRDLSIASTSLLFFLFPFFSFSLLFSSLLFSSHFFPFPFFFPLYSLLFLSLPFLQPWLSKSIFYFLGIHGW